jgi:hypothetical protein
MFIITGGLHLWAADLRRQNRRPATTRYLYRMTSLGDAAWAGLGSGTAPALRCVHAMDVDADQWTDTFEVPFPAASHMSRS